MWCLHGILTPAPCMYFISFHLFELLDYSLEVQHVNNFFQPNASTNTVVVFFSSNTNDIAHPSMCCAGVAQCGLSAVGNLIQILMDWSQKNGSDVYQIQKRPLGLMCNYYDASATLPIQWVFFVDRRTDRQTWRHCFTSAVQACMANQDC